MCHRSFNQIEIKGCIVYSVRVHDSWFMCYAFMEIATKSNKINNQIFKTLAWCIHPTRSLFRANLFKDVNVNIPWSPPSPSKASNKNKNIIICNEWALPNYKLHFQPKKKTSNKNKNQTKDPNTTGRHWKWLELEVARITFIGHKLVNYSLKLEL